MEHASIWDPKPTCDNTGSPGSVRHSADALPAGSHFNSRTIRIQEVVSPVILWLLGDKDAGPIGFKSQDILVKPYAVLAVTQFGASSFFVVVLVLRHHDD